MMQLSRNKGIVCSNTRASMAQQAIYPLSGNNGILAREKNLNYSQTGEQLSKENVWNKGNKKTRKSLSLRKNSLTRFLKFSTKPSQQTIISCLS